MLWDPFLYCINDSIQGNSETGNKVFVLPSEVSINNLVWTVADILNALMAIPNLVAVLLLSNVVVKETKKYIHNLDTKDDTPIEIIDK